MADLEQQLNWTYEDKDAAARQGWSLHHAPLAGMYMPYGYPRLLPAGRTYGPIEDPEEAAAFQLVLTHAMCGCPSATKALEAIVATNPQFREYAKTVEAMQCQ